MGRNGENKNQFVKADERQRPESDGGDDCSSEFDLGRPPMLLAYFVKDWGIGPPFLMRCGATDRVSGSTMTRCSRCCDVSESWPGVGQGDKFKPSDITGGCLALT